MEAIQSKYPYLLSDRNLKSDVAMYHKLKSETISLSVDIDCCNSDDPDKMCSDCNCWKRTRAYCG